MIFGESENTIQSLQIHKGLAPYLRDMGHNVDDAFDGHSAFKMIESNDYDLVLTDIRMPVMDGITLLKKINEIKPHIAQVVISAYGDMDMVIRTLRQSVMDFLIKPVKLMEIDALIEKVLRKRDLKQDENSK